MPLSPASALVFPAPVELPVAPEPDTPAEGLAPALAPDEPALPLMRPLASGVRLTSVLPGAGATEPATEDPGELLAIEPLAPPALAACWLHASKSAWVCEKA
jgi:hypothetical protein